MTSSDRVYPRQMRRVWLLSFIVACTKANPAVLCTDTTCSDPAYPFCDVGGEIGGIPGTCIAVTCTPGEFGACRGDDVALTCNAAGTSFDDVQCEMGCSVATSGCKLCEPNQTVCTNGTLATCDATGQQTASSCPLGCFEDQPRCRDIDPSNRLATYMDMVQNPADLDLSVGQWNVFLKTGSISSEGPGATTLTVPSFMVPSPSGGPQIRVFVVENLKLGNVFISTQPSDPPTAVAFIASGDITVSGAVTLDGTAGSLTTSSCVGIEGYTTTAQANGAGFWIGAGGGGGATPGAAGAVVTDSSGLWLSLQQAAPPSERTICNR